MNTYESFKRADAMVKDLNLPIDLKGLSPRDRERVLKNRPDYNPDNG